jgi:glutathione S-transferase
MSNLTLYVGPLSLYSRKVEIALREKNLEFEQVLVPFTQERGYTPRHPEVVAANPKRQVPVLVDGELTLFDSTVIVEYLEEQYPEPALYPKDPPAKARCRLVELEADEILFAPVRHLLYRTEPPLPDAERQALQEAEGKRAETELQAQFTDLDQRLSDRLYFCGDFSAADIGMFMTVLFTQRLKGPHVSSHTHLARWYARMLDRPSCAQAAAEIAEADRNLSPALGGPVYSAAERSPEVRSPVAGWPTVP